MKIVPTAERFAELAQEGNLVPVYADLMADVETPVSVYAKLRAGGQPAYLLESVVDGAHLNRYSFIAAGPRKMLKSYPDGRALVKERGASAWKELPAKVADPLDLLQDELAPYRPVKVPGMPPFVGGAVGYIGYEYIHVCEPTVPLAAEDPLQVPVTFFMLTDTVVIFDRANQTLRLLHNAYVGEDGPQAAYERAVAELAALEARLQESHTAAPTPLPADVPIEVPEGNFTRERFEKMVEDVKEYIRAGDVIQVVGSQRFDRDFAASPLDLYRALRTVNPSPYMFCFDTGELALVGASPEVHVRLTGDLVEIRPIAGTRPRGRTFDEDMAHEKDLLADEKERAEHLMLVDLARNDIGRVCRFGSVHVPDYMVVERYSHVMHIVSQVEGKLNEGRTAFDLLRATFPAGTVSGAPKVRAMQIIAEQEGEQRGSYAGVLGYFSYDGNLDSCITLRTALLQNARIHIQSGAGLVADSVPATEYEETVHKASAMLKAVAMAERISGNRPVTC